MTVPLEVLPGVATPPGRWASIQAHVRTPLFRDAYALIASTAVTTGLGMASWVAAARLYDVDQVGRAQSAVNLLVILAGLGNLRLMNVLTRYLPRAGDRSASLVGRCYLLATAGSLVACAVYLTRFRAVLPVGELLGPSPLAGVWLTVAVVGFSVFTLQDAVLTALRRASWVLVENGAHSAAKLVLVVVLAASMPTTGIFASWVVPTLVALVPVNLLVFSDLLPRHAARHFPGRRDAAAPGSREDVTLGRLAPFAAAEYAGALCELGVANLIPLVVAERLGLAAAGVFGAAWLIGTTLDHVVVHFGASLTVEGATHPDRLPRLARELLRRSAQVVLPLAAGVALGAPLILGVFGAEYAEEAGGLLRLLGLALVPRLVCTVAVVIARVEERVRAVVGIQAALAIGTIVGSLALLDGLGVAAPGLAYLATSTVVAIAVAPSLAARLRRGGG